MILSLSFVLFVLWSNILCMGKSSRLFFMYKGGFGCCGCGIGECREFSGVLGASV